jgi:hypothetical protein
VLGGSDNVLGGSASNVLGGVLQSAGRLRCNVLTCCQAREAIRLTPKAG